MKEFTFLKIPVGGNSLYFCWFYICPSVDVFQALMVDLGTDRFIRQVSL